MSQRYSFIATCPKGLEQLLASEISALGAELNRETVGAMSFSADVATAYRICLWSRLANRVLLVLTEFRGESADALYDGLKNLKWDEHLSADSKITVDFNGQSNDIRNTHFGALKSKDAIVDYFLARGRSAQVLIKKTLMCESMCACARAISP